MTKLLKIENVTFKKLAWFQGKKALAEKITSRQIRRMPFAAATSFIKRPSGYDELLHRR